MTLADERYRSLVQTKHFLYSLMDSNQTPRVPKIIRQQARSLLRHWPDDYHLDCMCESMPQYFAKKLDPLYKMVKKFDEENKNDTGT